MTLLSRAAYELWSDFENTTTGVPFTQAVSGTGATITVQAAESGHPGIMVLQTGTTTTGRTCFITDGTQFLLGGGPASFETLIQIPDLSDGTDTYSLRFGFYDSASADATDGVYFEYDSASHANWRICAASNGSRTKTNTSVAVAPDVWIKLRLDVNADGTSAEFFIDGISVGTVATNIPTGAGRQTGIGALLLKSAGTNNRTAWFDYIWAKIALTTSR